MLLLIMDTMTVSIYWIHGDKFVIESYGKQ